MDPWSEQSRRFTVLCFLIGLAVVVTAIAVPVVLTTERRMDAFEVCVGEGQRPLECREATR